MTFVYKPSTEMRANESGSATNQYSFHYIFFMSDWGAVIIKFWVQIDKDTQLARFEERQNTPEKQWKITDEDWRNREKWDLYETAVNEMLKKTNTTYAPWHVLESNDKKYARIKALKIVIDAIEAALDNKTDKK